MASDRVWGDQKTKTVILDTSAVLMLFEFSIDLKAELTRLIGRYHILVPTSVVDELQMLARRGRGKQSQMAKAALKFIENYKTIDTVKHGDEAMVDLARSLHCAVVTNDRELRNRLKEIPVPVVFLRAKQKLMLE
jgi:rRNA-processing protein FCF1